MVRLRIAAAADAENVNAVYDYYIAHTTATFNEIHKTVEQRAHEMELLLKTHPFLIAEDENGRFLGFACAEPIRSQSGYRWCAELTIYLHPDTPRQCGTGTALYTALLNTLSGQGFCMAAGVVSGENVASMALHRRFGFHEAARFPRCAYKQGRWLDAVLYTKELRARTDAPPALIPFEIYQKKAGFPAQE